MINILGSKTVVVDSDALIGLIHNDDALHERSVKVSEFLSANSFATIVPYPIVLEAATTLSRARVVRRPDLASKLLRDYAGLEIEEDFQEIANLVASLFDEKTSKENTPFDHYVLATAIYKGTDTVFSFDPFYKKHGLKLAFELLD